MKLKWTLSALCSLSLLSLGCGSDNKIVQSPTDGEIEVAAKQAVGKASAPGLNKDKPKQQTDNDGTSAASNNNDKSKGPNQPPPGLAKVRWDNFTQFHQKLQAPKPKKSYFDATLENFALSGGAVRTTKKGQIFARKMDLSADLSGSDLEGSFAAKVNANIDAQGKGVLFGSFVISVETSQLAPLPDAALPVEFRGRFTARVTNFDPQDIGQLLLSNGQFSGRIKSGTAKGIKLQAKVHANELKGRLIVPADMPPGGITSSATFSFSNN